MFQVTHCEAFKAEDLPLNACASMHIADTCCLCTWEDLSILSGSYFPYLRSRNRNCNSKIKSFLNVPYSNIIC